MYSQILSTLVDQCQSILNKYSFGNNLKDIKEMINKTKNCSFNEHEITKLKAEVKDKTNKKKELTETLVTIMKGNSIDCFDINGGALVYKKRKTKQSISGKFLLAQLEEYYKEQPELAKEITKKVLDNRVEVFKDEIKRKIDK